MQTIVTPILGSVLGSARHACRLTAVAAVFATAAFSAPQASAATQLKVMTAQSARLICGDRGYVAGELLRGNTVYIPFVSPDKRWECYVRTTYRYTGHRSAPRAANSAATWSQAFVRDGRFEMRRAGYPQINSSGRNPRRGVTVGQGGGGIETRISVVHLVGRTPSGSHKMWARTSTGGRQFLLHGGRLRTVMEPQPRQSVDNNNPQPRNVRVMDALRGNVNCGNGQIFRLPQDARYRNKFTLPNIGNRDPRGCQVNIYLRLKPGTNARIADVARMIACVTRNPEPALGYFTAAGRRTRLTVGRGIAVNNPYIIASASLHSIYPANARVASLNIQAGCAVRNGVFHRLLSDTVTIRR